MLETFCAGLGQSPRPAPSTSLTYLTSLLTREYINMPLTKTSNLPELTRSPPDSVTFAFPPHSPPDDEIAPTLITFRPSSTISTSLHWHTTHTEYIKVLSGAALVMVAGKVKIYTAEDGTAVVPRYARHEWMRFDRPAHLLSKKQMEYQEKWMEEQGEDIVQKLKKTEVVAEEWTEPKDGEKEIFFRNLFSSAREPQWKGSWLGGVYMVLQIMCVMWKLDNYIVLVDLGGKGDGSGWRGFVEAVISYSVMGLASAVGRLMGLMAVNEEYTPGWLMRSWEEGGRPMVR